VDFSINQQKNAIYPFEQLALVGSKNCCAAATCAHSCNLKEAYRSGKKVSSWAVPELLCKQAGNAVVGANRVNHGPPFSQSRPAWLFVLPNV
jgi:hypothetical protein